MKRYLIITLLTLLSMTSNAYDVCIDGIYYNLVTKAKQAMVTYGTEDVSSYSGDVIVPDKILYENVEYTVTSIGEYAFRQASITSVSIPNTVKTIGHGAFAYCDKLYTISLPNSITTIGHSAFAYSSIGSVNLPISLVGVEDMAFYCCNNLESVTFPNSLRTIGLCAFSHCTSLSSIIIPNSVELIGNSAFRYCESITSVTIPRSVTTIHNYAFDGCDNLKRIVLCNNADTYFAGDIFSNCPNLEYVICKSKEVLSMDLDNFMNSFIDYATLYVPAKSLDSYRNDETWSNFGSIIPTLFDDEELSIQKEEIYDRCSYIRNFTNTNWNALYVPFSMSYDDWAEDFEVARLNDVHQFDDDEDGVVDRTVLELIKLKEGSMTEPNTPYMIKAKEVGEKTITLTDATLYATEENSFDVTSWYTRFTFTGTYSTVTDMATKGHYALANGNLMQATSDDATLGAFRWYLDITDRNGNPAPLKARKVFLSFDDGETTEIDVVVADKNSSSSDIFTLSGVKVSGNKTSLPKGLYISNGKKMLVK